MWNNGETTKAEDEKKEKERQEKEVDCTAMNHNCP